MGHWEPLTANPCTSPNARPVPHGMTLKALLAEPACLQGLQHGAAMQGRHHAALPDARKKQGIFPSLEPLLRNSKACTCGPASQKSVPLANDPGPDGSFRVSEDVSCGGV